MRQRCVNAKCRSWKYYGARGIRVCERWDVFENFLADMGPKPSSKHSLDRIDSNGNYEPGNVRWATPQQQTRNRRLTNRVTFGGKPTALADVAAKIGMKLGTLHYRVVVGGWGHERAVSQPIGNFGENHGQAKLTELLVAEARRRFAGGESYRSIARRFGVARRTITNAITRETWGHVP